MTTATVETKQQKVYGIIRGSLGLGPKDDLPAEIRDSMALIKIGDGLGQQMGIYATIPEAMGMTTPDAWVLYAHKPEVQKIIADEVVLYGELSKDIVLTPDLDLRDKLVSNYIIKYTITSLRAIFKAHIPDDSHMRARSISDLFNLVVVHGGSLPSDLSRS